jgi:uncharacterized protein (DUF58 family)
LNPAQASAAPAGRAAFRAGDLRQRLSASLTSLARQAPLDADGFAQIGRRHIYILPTGVGVAFGSVLALMLIGSLNYQNNLGLLFTFLMGSVALVAMHHTWFDLLGLRVLVRGGVPVFAGNEAEFSVWLADTRGRPRGAIAVRVGPSTSPPADITASGEVAVQIRLPTMRRGLRTVHTVVLETRYPLGLFRAWSYARAEARVTVYPQPARRALDPPLAAAYRPNTQGDRGVGADDFVGFRDYRVGDSLRHLDWKALARERGLVLKQFGGDRAEEVWLDWERLPSVGVEERVGLLCRQVLDAAENGLSYGLRVPGTTIPMSHGELHKHQCLAALATFEHG